MEIGDVGERDMLQEGGRKASWWSCGSGRRCGRKAFLGVVHGQKWIRNGDAMMIL